ncbi:condensation domain-containing protein [Rhodococcus pyridinivorans]|uniref:Condensation domain-containing protein n=1 Tax=Rhodococcus pyridinivorans TaxID=103816 RepID=A0A7M2XWA2_9NOCA|nr:hypothetical protein [Rhodococcus pyridinivorans]QOW02036.1 hypothetical protein INP59_27060 [Rhodococcus pyridinivorans]
MSNEGLSLTWGQAAMIEMFHRRGLDPSGFPLSVVFDEHNGHTDRDGVLGALHGLATRHDVLTAVFEDADDTLDLTDSRTFPRQLLSGETQVSPFTIEVASTDAPLTSEQVRELARSEFKRRGRAFMPILINRGGSWQGGIVVSHVAVDGTGLEMLRDEYHVILEGGVPGLRAARVDDVLKVECSPEYAQVEQENLAIVHGLLQRAEDANLNKGRAAEFRADPATFAVVDSAKHAQTLAELSAMLRVTKSGISLIVYAILLSAELSARQVVVRSQFHRQPPARDAVSAIANAPFAFSSVAIDPDLSFADLVRREFGSVVEGYRASLFSPYGYERVKRMVALDRGMEELNGIPEFMYLPKAGRPRERARKVAASKVERTLFEVVPGFQPYSRGNLSIFEESDHDSLKLFGHRWREFSDSLEVVRTFHRFCAIAATNVDLKVGEILGRARTASDNNTVSLALL